MLDQAEVDDETIDLKVETSPVAGADRAGGPHPAAARRRDRAEADRTLRRGARLPRPPAHVPLEQGRPTTVEKIVALYSSRDRAIAESRHEARLAVADAGDFGELLARHAATWNTAWHRFDIEMDSANEWTATVLHLHIFHLLQTVSPQTTPPGRRGACPRAGTGRPTGATSSGTSCSSSRS